MTQSAGSPIEGTHDQNWPPFVQQFAGFVQCGSLVVTFVQPAAGTSLLRNCATEAAVPGLHTSRPLTPPAASSGAVSEKGGSGKPDVPPPMKKTPRCAADDEKFALQLGSAASSKTAQRPRYVTTPPPRSVNWSKAR